MFNKENKPKDLLKDLSKVLKEEGDFVQQLSEVATKGAELHARLEAIQKALEEDPCAYNTKEADKMVKKAEEKYKSELEGKMKEAATDKLKDSK